MDENVDFKISESNKNEKNINENDVQVMIEICSKKLEQEPFHIKALLLRSGSYMKAKNFEKAYDDIEKIIKIDPNNSNHYHLKGCILEKLEKYQEAIEALNKALEYNENNANALFLRAACHNKLENIQQSLEDYNLAIEKDSMNFQSPNQYKNIEKVLEKGESFNILDNLKRVTLSPTDLTKDSNSDLFLNLEKTKTQSPKRQPKNNQKKKTTIEFDKARNSNLNLLPNKTSKNHNSMITLTNSEIKNLKNNSNSKHLSSLNNKSDLWIFSSPQKKKSSLIKGVKNCYTDKKNTLSPSKTQIINQVNKKSLNSPDIRGNKCITMNSYLFDYHSIKRQNELKDVIVPNIQINEKKIEDNLTTHYQYEFFRPNSILKKTDSIFDFSEYKNNYLLDLYLDSEISQENTIIENIGENSSLIGSVLDEYKNQNFLKSAELINRFLEIENQIVNRLKGFLIRGIINLKLKYYLDSMDDLLRILKLEPNNIRILFLQGICYEMLGDYENMSKIYDLVVQNQPENNYYFRRGVALQSLELYQEALLDYTTVINSDSNNQHAFFNRAVCFEKLGHLKQAEIDYELASNLDSNNAIYLIHYAYLIEKIDFESNLEVIRRTYDRILILNPEYSEVYNNLGMLEESIRDHKKAIFHFTKAIEIEPSNYVFWYNRGVSLMGQGKLNLALDDLNQSIKLEKSYSLYEIRGYLYTQIEMYDQAIEDYSIIINDQKEDLNILFNRAFCYSKLALSEEAITDYLKIIDLNNYNDLAYFYNGLENQKLERYNDAIRYYTKAIYLNSTNLNCFLNRGKCYEKIQCYEQANEDFEFIKQAKSSS